MDPCGVAFCWRCATWSRPSSLPSEPPRPLPAVAAAVVGAPAPVSRRCAAERLGSRRRRVSRSGCRWLASAPPASAAPTLPSRPLCRSLCRWGPRPRGWSWALRHLRRRLSFWKLRCHLSLPISPPAAPAPLLRRCWPPSWRRARGCPRAAAALGHRPPWNSTPTLPMSWGCCCPCCMLPSPPPPPWPATASVRSCWQRVRGCCFFRACEVAWRWIARAACWGGASMHGRRPSLPSAPTSRATAPDPWGFPQGHPGQRQAPSRSCSAASSASSWARCRAHWR
mmetsp:Transcript_79597/g.257917  ORF Transcript_79597/g.257917 Transcript_79597/m.257917 type:complete len:282 (-) Transcript_79597:276-1121(-)